MRCDRSPFIPCWSLWKPERLAIMNYVKKFVNKALKFSSDTFIILRVFPPRDFHSKCRFSFFYLTTLASSSHSEKKNLLFALKGEKTWLRVRHMRCDIPCLYFTAGLRRPLWWHGYEVARWLLVSTITTLSTSLKWHCPGQQSTFFGPCFFFFFAFFLIFCRCAVTFYRSLKLLNSLQPLWFLDFI